MLNQRYNLYFSKALSVSRRPAHNNLQVICKRKFVQLTPDYMSNVDDHNLQCCRELCTIDSLLQQK